MSLPIEEGELTHVWKGSMQCNGTEHRLEDCGRQFFDNYLCRTGGYEYAGVKCFTGMSQALSSVICFEI